MFSQQQQQLVHEVRLVSADAMVLLMLQCSHVSSQYLDTVLYVSYVPVMLGDSSFHTRTCNPPAKGFAQQTLTDAAGSPVHCCWTFWGGLLSGCLLAPKEHCRGLAGSLVSHPHCP